MIAHKWNIPRKLVYMGVLTNGYPFYTYSKRARMLQDFLNTAYQIRKLRKDKLSGYAMLREHALSLGHVDDVERVFLTTYLRNYITL